MNALDVALVLFALSAVFGGWRAGFVHRAFSWLGLFGGILVASIVLRRIASATEVATDAPALLRSLAVLVVGAVLGNAVGTWLGSRASAAVDESAFDLLDSAGGALLGLASTALMAWMVLPTMTMVPGWPADIARSSVVASRLNRALGPAPDVLDGVSQSLGLGAFDGLWHLMEQIDIGGLQPEAPLELYGFEASPYTRIAREALCELELPYLLHPVGKGSKERAAFVERSGKMMVPWLADPNTGVELFESAEIRRYLYETYAQ